mgnify:CR=1 FL=1
MAKVILKDIKKIYPNTEKKKKVKKGEEPEKKNHLQITDEGVVAVQQFSLEIADREFIVLVGPSGCGKSTTLRMVAGLEEISGGELYIGGQLMNDVAPKDRDISMVFQNYALYPHMTVRENIAFPLKLRKMDKAEIDQLLKLYRQQFPDDEGSYDCEADVCRDFNDHRREEAVLREALETLKVAPKCAMQLAVMLFERGEYQEALRHAQRALRDSIQTQMGVNEAHLSYLSGLAKFAILLLDEEANGYPEAAVLDIYTDFETALRQGLNSTYRSTLKQRAIRLVVKSKINVPSDCEELNYLLS